MDKTPRQIKLRAWHSGLNGWLVSSDRWYVTPEGEIAFYGVTKNIIPAPQEEVILEQFTGLHDKNGTEIYEGDIVRLIEQARPAAVIFEEGQFSVQVTTRRTVSSPLWAEASTCEVIGNVYLNPDLIESATHQKEA